MRRRDWLEVQGALRLSWTELAGQLGVSARQIFRYRDEEHATPLKVQLAIEGLMCRLKHGGEPVREIDRLQEVVRNLSNALAMLEHNSFDRQGFVGSREARHFHRRSCEYAEWIHLRNLIEFAGHEEAVAAGYQPCKTCRS